MIAPVYPTTRLTASWRRVPYRIASAPSFGSRSHFYSTYHTATLMGRVSGQLVRRRFTTDASKEATKESLFQKYNRCLEAQPLLTKAISSLFIVAGGDVIAQVFISGALETEQGLDFVRIARMGVLGGGFIGPTLHIWYSLLYRMVPGAGVGSVIGRVAADQFGFAPLFVVGFFAGLFGLEGRLGDLQGFLEESWWDTVQANWKLWIPAMAVTFSVIPFQYQVLWVNGVATGWNTYLSWKAHDAAAVEEAH